MRSVLGFRYKIAYALQEINFSGDLFVIDVSEDVLKYVKDKYCEILPDANVICINKNFEDSFEEVPEEIDLLLANHCIDDMIISNYLEGKGMYGEDESKDVITNAWISLGKDQQKTQEIIEKIYDTFNGFFNKKNIKLVLMSQYKSNLYFKEDFEEMDRITEQCFNKIKNLTDTDDQQLNQMLNFYPFGNDERYMGEELLINTQNAKNWISGKIKNK